MPTGGGAGEVCGNGSCGSGENVSNCPGDCGGNSGDGGGSGEQCGNGFCGSGENVSNCPSDCGGDGDDGGGSGEQCGNGFCGSGENVSNCPGDCGGGGSGGGNCSSSAGVPCSTDYEAQYSSQWRQHGPGDCENTGTDGTSFESLSVSIPSQVSPGQSLTMTVEWNRCDDCNPNGVIYTSFVGNWDPDNPLQVSDAYFTTCGETARDSVTFVTPTQQGTYRVRWIHCFAFDAIYNFCGDGLPGPSANPGVCPYVERTSEVCE